MLSLIVLVSLAVAPQGPDGRLDQELEAIAGKPLPGVAVGVVRDGRVETLKVAGMADVAANTAITPSTIFRLGSVTKSFTALAILQLHEQNKLSLADPLSKYVPDYPHAARITVEQLLGHTAGVPDFLPMEEVFKRPLDSDPGTRINYSNNGYLLLGRVIERASGLPWEAYLKRHVFDPAGMTRTGYDADPLLPGRATGYQLSGNGTYTPVSAGDARGAQAAGGLYSTIEDMTRWELALASGKLVRPETLARASAPGVLPGGRRAAYGLGFMTGTYRGVREVGHGGDITGYNSYVARYPDERFTVIVLSNVGLRPAGLVPDAGKLARAVAEIGLAGRLKDAVAPVRVAVPPAVLDTYVGVYRLEAPEIFIRNMGGRDIRILREGDRLSGEVGSARMPLDAHSPTEFQAPGSPAVLTFIPGAEAGAPCQALVLTMMGLREFRAVRVQ
ncbi:MAG: serine hydrolase domain-containing protein [Vicinamibacterales bacterium]|nr:serine hydrolase domain-containing protein [Vicinamibacterales bacterium]